MNLVEGEKFSIRMIVLLSECQCRLCVGILRAIELARSCRPARYLRTGAAARAPEAL